MPIKNDIVFIHIPKCAGTSIEQMMGIKQTEDECFGKKIIKHVHSQYVFQLQHLTLSQMIKFNYIPNDVKYTFTFVRNPFDRLVSEWAWGGSWFPDREIYGNEQSNSKGWESFESFLLFVKNHVQKYKKSDFLWCHFAPQTTFLHTNIDFIGRVENFNHDIKTVFPDSAVIHTNKRQHNSTESYYNHHLANIVRQIYHHDFLSLQY